MAEIIEDRSLPINCPACGYQSDERYDNVMLMSSGERLYRRGIRIVHRCTQFDGDVS